MFNCTECALLLLKKKKKVLADMILMKKSQLSIAHLDTLLKSAVKLSFT